MQRNTFSVKHNIGNLTKTIDSIEICDNELVIHYSDVKKTCNMIASISNVQEDKIDITLYRQDF